MLAMVAFTLEISPIGKAKYETHLAFSGNFGEHPEVSEAPVMLSKQSPQARAKEARESSRPDMNRDIASPGTIGSGASLPANHTNHNTVKPWSWPGFLRDEPVPKTRSLGEAEGDARQRFGLASKNIARPRRRNI
jgi:hypothetical protein